MAYNYALCTRSGKLFNGFNSRVIPIDENGKFKSSMFLEANHLNSNHFIWSENLQDLLDMKIDFLALLDKNRGKYDSAMPGLYDKMRRVVLALKPCIPCVDYLIPVDDTGNPLR